MREVHTIQFRERRRSAAGQNAVRRWGIGAAGILSLLLAAAAIYAAYLYAGLTQALPPVETIAALLEPPNGSLLHPTRIYDRTGNYLLITLQNPKAAERTYLHYPGLQPNLAGEYQAVLPANLITATYASADDSLWSQMGFSLSEFQGETRNTLAERLTSDLLFSNEPEGFRRSLREKIVAAQLTQRYGPEKVLEWYLNNANFGYLAYGADPGAQLFFGKQASELSLAEAAVMAAVAENPGLDVFKTPEVVFERQKEILQTALGRRLITPAQGIEAFREAPQLHYVPSQTGSPAYITAETGLDSAVTSLVFSQISSKLSQSRLERGGLRIMTTIDTNLQNQVECASQIQLERLTSPEGQLQDTVPDGCVAAGLLPSWSSSSRAAFPEISAELVVIDPNNGQILALGGESASEGESLPVHQSAFLEHEAGSLASLFVYAAGFTRGLSPGSLVWDIPAEDSQGSEQAYHGPVRLRNAMTNDYLVPADAVLEQVGFENALRITRQLGVEAPESSEEFPKSVNDLLRPLNLLEVSHALSVFANQGSLAGRGIDSDISGNETSLGQKSQLPPLEPTLLLKVEQLDGTPILDWSQPQSRPIITPQLAYLFTNVLSDETSRWPSLGHPNPLEIGRPAAARYSRTMDWNSHWVTGYTPRYFVGIWMGRSGPEEGINRESGLSMRSAATGLWHAVIQYASQNQPYEVFEIPQGVNFLQVCDPSGLLPTAACPNVVDEVFLNGNEPLQYDTLYRLMAINRDTGNLATIFTSPELVEQRAFILVPQEAERWAKEAGFETPPVNFDSLPAKVSTWEYARIQSPDLFSYLSGKISISGTAAGPEFSFYRIQYGQGPNPNQWFSIGEDSALPVTAGQLQEWDTTGLDGLYAVQLLLVRKDQSAERSTIFVSVDNQSPQVEILRPLEAESIRILDQSKIVLQSKVNDNLGIDQVAIIIDGRTFATLTQPPYAISWELQLGRHTLQVVATDLAGNIGQAESEFMVE